MKITAEFNSNEELINFVNMFNPNKPICAIESIKGVVTPVINVEPKDVEKIKEEVTQKVSNTIKQDKAQEPKDEVKVDEDPKEEPQGDKKEEPKVTREMVRAKFSELFTKGKQKEAMAIVTKFKASKLPEVKEEDLPAVLKEAEALL